jgi:hypothetical protein
MAHYITNLLWENWIVILFTLVTINFLSNYFYNGLHKYPGPPFAHCTNFWRFLDVLKGQPHLTHLRLHRTHGDIVRIGPNVLSFANPKALRTIYAINRGFVKVPPQAIEQVLTQS